MFSGATPTPSKATPMFPATPSASYLFEDPNLSYFNPEDHNNNQIRHSDVGEGFQPEYVPFADLPKLSDNCDIDQLLNHIRVRLEAPQSWHPYFEAITDIRSLYKNLPERVNQVMACFATNLIQSLYHRKNCIVKNAAVALADVYEHADKFPVAYEYTYAVLNSLLSKAMSTTKSCRPLLDRALNNLIGNNCCDQLLQQLCEVATNHNRHVGATGFHFLAVALNRFQAEISKFDQKTNQMIFKTISYVMEFQKDGKQKEIARNIIKFYGQKMGQEGFVGFLQFMVSSGFMRNEEAALIYNTCGKPEKVHYPRLSVEVSRLRQSHQGYRQSTVA
jgi:hypothetical protein